MVTMHAILAWEYWPLMNFVLLVSGGMFVAVRSPKWTGPIQAVLIASLAEEVRRMNLRVGQLEQNTSVQYADLGLCLDALRVEIRNMASKVGHSLVLGEKIVELQAAQGDTDQQLQFFKDLGCGHPECPRNRPVKE